MDDSMMDNQAKRQKLSEIDEIETIEGDDFAGNEEIPRTIGTFGSNSSRSTPDLARCESPSSQSFQKEIQGLKAEIASVKHESKILTNENNVLRGMIEHLQQQIDDLKKTIGEVDTKATSHIGEVKKTMHDRYRSFYPDEPVLESEMIDDDLEYSLTFGETSREPIIPAYNLKEMFRQIVECPKPISVVLKRFIRKMITETIDVEVLALYTASSKSPKFTSFPVEIFVDLREKLFFCLPAKEQNEDLRQFLNYKIKDVLNDMFKEARSKVKNPLSPNNGF
uniref:Uncharacterized protein n=1 Tax=Panagrolaimus sp. JU765 TaxID=591449 RepID=A0AC34R259_9BILA